MALHTDLSIHKAGTQLLVLAAQIHAQLPRGFKRTVGDKIVAHCSEMLDAMAMANSSRAPVQRGAYIEEVLMHVRSTTVWLRVGKDLPKGIPLKHWAASTALLNSVGKQATGWKKKTNEKAPAA